MTEMNFAAIPVELPVTVGDSEYILREASEEVAVNYRNKSMDCTMFNEEGKPIGVKGLADVEVLLVSKCLFTKGNTSVPASTILSWPARTVKALFVKVREISGFDDEEETEESLHKQQEEIEKKLKKLRGKSEKNPSGSMTDTSA